MQKIVFTLFISSPSSRQTIISSHLYTTPIFVLTHATIVAAVQSMAVQEKTTFFKFVVYLIIFLGLNKCEVKNILL